MPVDTTAAAAPTEEPGPLAPPGRYEVRLVVDGAPPLTKPLVLAKDPRLAGVGDEDLREQFELAMKIRGKTMIARQAVLDMRSLRAQAAERVTNARSPAVGLAADVVSRRLSEVESGLAPTPSRGRTDPPTIRAALIPRLVALGRSVDDADARPDAAAAAAFAALSAELDACLQRLRGVIENEVTAFNRMLENAQMAPLALPATLPR
jgi:hypothetical protein